METRKQTLSNLEVCRFCLTQTEKLIPLYDKSRTSKNSVSLGLKILSCIAVEVFPSDKMPQFICKRCKLFMEVGYAFKQLCRQADENILHYIQNSAPLSPISYPLQLSKIYRSCSKSDAVVKTVVEGGVKVMAEEVSDSDTAEDDNVFNIKIGDGSEEGKSIKIITSVGKNDSPSETKSRKDSEDGEQLIIEGGCFACDECESTYPLEQLLMLHKAQKHRERNASCDECGRKFFSKYDLIAHQSTHFAEKSFQCAVCCKKFKRLLLLKRHEKQVHADLPQHKCEDCPASFLSPDELESHQAIHDRNSPRRFVCQICDKRFSNKLILQRHQDYVHNKKAAFSCQYCSERFASVSKLTRHVRAHAGARSYPCKHCGKSFTKSHHYTRHLRLKHQTELSGHAYRCDECDATFATQDELLYHSALHATKNLVCPLCQEKFENVDAVTAHIKSHVNGSEYMCDFCELIFTSKEKLDGHIAAAHEDELMTNEQETEPDESSMDMDAAEDDEEDNSINVKEENGHMVVEIKNTNEFMLPIQRDEEDKPEQTQSEDSDAAESQPDPAQSSIPGLMISEDVSITVVPEAEKQITVIPNPAKETASANTNQQPNILMKVNEMKRKALLQSSTPDKSITEKKDKKAVSKVESSTPSGASDKSLRLLEKELQDLKRTNTLVSSKTPAKGVESARGWRPLPSYTSTPKTRMIEKKDTPTPKPAQERVTTLEKKVERKTFKDSKELKEVKSNNNNVKEDKELKDKGNGKENKDERKEVKEKETPKSGKNGASESTPVEEAVRRSNRPSKVKDYAKMIRDGAIASDDESEDEDSDKEVEKTPERTETKPAQIFRSRRIGRPPIKASPAANPAAAPRKRGRPRKEQPVPAKVKKDGPSDEEADAAKSTEDTTQKDTPKEIETVNTPDGTKTPEENRSPLEPNSNVVVSPSGQTLKKVPIKSLPPGVKPLPLPVNPRLPGGREVCEMQIGKKVVKVQKIVMTKAEVEAMAKKGLVEMKDGTMVLKQGIKLPSADPMSLKSKLMGEAESKKESPSKADSAPSTETEFAS